MRVVKKPLFKVYKLEAEVMYLLLHLTPLEQWAIRCFTLAPLKTTHHYLQFTP
jgi:hypothetical protein